MFSRYKLQTIHRFNDWWKTYSTKLALIQRLCHAMSESYDYLFLSQRDQLIKTFLQY